MLQEAALEVLYQVICERLAVSSMDNIRPGEGEASYTRRVVLPLVVELVDEADVSGLMVGGAYTGINRPVRYLGADFHPDIAVLHHERRMVAIEVKFLGPANRSGLVSKSLGQTTIYKLAGYQRGITLLLDRSSRLRPHHLRHAQDLSAPVAGMAVVLRLRGARGFREGAILYPTA